MEYIYGALLLHKLGRPVNEENLKKALLATGAHADDAKAKTLIASLHGDDIAKELENASSIAMAPAGASAPAEKKEEKKEEEKPSESAAGLSALFG